MNSDDAIRHWSLFGQRGQPSAHRVLPTEMPSKKPFQKPQSAPWDASVSPANLPQLLNGFRMRAMEDKWFVYADGPDAQGNAVLHMHRSWTGHKNIELKISVPLDEEGEFKEEDARITEITWETDESIFRAPGVEEMKEMAAEVCSWVLNVRLKIPS